MGKPPFLSPVLIGIVALAGNFFSVAPGRAAPPGPALPPALQARLDHERNTDDLQTWIYDQLQWVAARPAPRSAQLVLAVNAAWRTPRNDQENQAWLDLLVNEGYALLRAGDIVRSTDAYTAALQWVRDHASIADEGLILNNILKPLGNNYTRLGDYEEADFIHHKALAIAILSKDREALAGTYSNLANTASNRGDPQQSMEYCRLGLRVAARHSPYRGLLLSEQADALSQLGRTGEARTIIRQAIVLLRGAMSRPEVADWLLVAYQQAGDVDSAAPASALHYYLHALDIVKTEQSHNQETATRETAKLYFRLADVYRRMREPVQATRWQDRCLSVLIPGKTFNAVREADLYAENTLADLFYSRALLSRDTAPTCAFTCFQYSFDVERLLRQQFVTNTSRERAVGDSRMRHETAIATAYDAWTETRSAGCLNAVLDFMETSKAQLLLDEQEQRRREQDTRASILYDSIHHRIQLLEQALTYYREELAHADADDSVVAVLTNRQRQTELDLAVLRKKMPGAPARDGANTISARWLPDPGTEVRSFFAGDSALYEVAVGHAGIVFAERIPLGPAWQDSVRHFLHRWFEQGPNNMIDRPRTYFEQAFALWQMLFSAHPLRPDKHYIILPDGALDLLPVEALPTQAVYAPAPQNWPLVVRKCDISYAWSLQMLGETGRSPGNPGGFTGLFIADNSRQLPSLRFVAAEERGIARAIGHGAWLIDSQATCAALRDALERSAVVHVSTHGFSGREMGSVPRIEMADSPFYIFQLATLQQCPALVVLSACRTGDGRMVVGEGIESMGRAFTAAGINGVVTGRWNVHDEATAGLMENFYRSLAQGVRPYLALSAAKRDWLNAPSVPYLEKLPWYWAAFSYQGSTSALPTGFYDHGVAPNSSRLLLLLLVGVCIALVVTAGPKFASRKG